MASGLPREERVLRAALARNARRLRDRKDWSQEEAAERLGVHDKHLQKLEYGSVNVTLKTVARICNGFGVTPHEVFCVNK